VIISLSKANVTLSHWNILCVSLPHGEYAELFVGYSHGDRLGRLSTKIKSYDEKLGKGETESGSTYQTVGEPGKPHGDAMYVLEQRLGTAIIEKELYAKNGSGQLFFKYPVVREDYAEIIKERYSLLFDEMDWVDELPVELLMFTYLYLHAVDFIATNDTGKLIKFGAIKYVDGQIDVTKNNDELIFSGDEDNDNAKRITVINKLMQVYMGHTKVILAGHAADTQDYDIVMLKHALEGGENDE